MACTKMTILLSVFALNSLLLATGVVVSWVDIHSYGAGLYLALVCVIVIVIVLALCAFCEQDEPTVAKQLYSKSRQTIRKYTVRRARRKTTSAKQVCLKELSSSGSGRTKPKVSFALDDSRTDDHDEEAASSSAQTDSACIQIAKYDLIEETSPIYSTDSDHEVYVL